MTGADGMVIVCFFISNAIFAFIYDVILGVSHFHGIETKTPVRHFFELFFFSSQTAATVGYGRINPATNIASFVAALDALASALKNGFPNLQSFFPTSQQTP